MVLADLISLGGLIMFYTVLNLALGPVGYQTPKHPQPGPWSCAAPGDPFGGKGDPCAPPSMQLLLQSCNFWGSFL